MMTQATRTNQHWLALAIWAAGLFLFGGLSWWNLQTFKEAGEDRMISEAGRIAAQIAGILSMPGVDMDSITARSVVMGAMEDDRIYAVRVDARPDVQEGQRRNYLWEPVPWDDEITDNCVQGMTPIRVGGAVLGKVEVWLSTRLEDEEDALLVERELWRFGLTSLIWTAVLVLVFWQWGGFKLLRHVSDGSAAANESRGDPEKVLYNLRNDDGLQGCGIAEDPPEAIVNARKGRDYQISHADSWLVTAGMFRQTFARGPALISRLYADGETAGLCHLGRILEQAAPCVGAEKLAGAARDMQSALNDPDCQSEAKLVEECVVALEDVLEALCGNGQWRTKSGITRGQ